MYSCSHFSDFLSDDQVKKQSDMSKRGQKTTSNEGSPMAQVRPCLLARDPRSEEISSQSLGSLVNPVNTDERQEADIAHTTARAHTEECRRMLEECWAEDEETRFRCDAAKHRVDGWFAGRVESAEK